MSASASTRVNRLIVNALKSIEKLSDETAGPKAQPKSRMGKKAISGHFDPAVAWQLRKLALDRGGTVQGLLEEALDDLFRKHHVI